MFDYLEEYEKSTGEQIEFDVVALCCEYSEYENMAEFVEAYGDDYGTTIEEIDEHTQVIDVDGTSFIIQDF